MLMFTLMTERDSAAHDILKVTSNVTKRFERIKENYRNYKNPAAVHASEQIDSLIAGEV